jgi:Glyoxalase-like domain
MTSDLLCLGPMRGGSVERPLISWAEFTLDYCDTQRAADFWSALLDLPASAESQEGWFQLGPTVAGGPVINIQPVAEEKVGKSGVHLDLWVDEPSCSGRCC